MVDERAIGRMEELLVKVTRLGGQNEITSIVSNLTVVDAAPAGLTNFITITDERDGDTILAKTVPGVIYAVSDKVNVLFVEGTEPIAFQQGSESPSGGLWEIVPSTSTDIFYDRGNVSIAKSTAPVTELDVNGDITLANQIIHSGDINTNIAFTDDDIEFTAGAISMLKLTEAGQDVVDIGDTAGTGDVDIDFSDGQILLRGSDGHIAVNTTIGDTVRLRVIENVFDTVINTAIVAETDTTNDTQVNYQSVGLNAINRYRGSNAATNAKGVRAIEAGMRVHNTNTTSHAICFTLDARNVSTGTVTNFYGTRVPAMLNSGGGTITNIYGHRVETQTVATNNFGFYQAGTGTNIFEDDMKVGASGAPTAQLHIDQASTTAAIPVAKFDQADISEEFFGFIGAAAAATLTQSLVDEGDVTTATRIGFFKIDVDDVGNQITDGVYFVPFFSLA